MEFFDVLVRYEVGLWNKVDQQLARSGQVSLATLHALRILQRFDGRARVQELSDQIGITVGAASKLVDRLERDQMAVRSRNPANRRSSLVALTAAGEQALQSAVCVYEGVLTSAFGDEDVEAVGVILRRLQTRLDAVASDVAA